MLNVLVTGYEKKKRRTSRNDSVPSKNFHGESVNIWKVGAIHKGGESIVPNHGIDLSLCLSSNLRIQSKC